jgi:hypothetical protein
MRAIPNYPGYFALTDGSIISTKWGYPHKKKTRQQKSGYVWTSISVNNKKQLCLVHRLIALAYIPNPKNHPCINHIDGNKANNIVSNLEWCTHRYNCLHAVAMGLTSKTRKSKSRDKEGYKYPVEHIDDILEMKHIFGFENKDLADLLGISLRTYSRVILKAWQQVGVK